jgi:hypothetical protein
MDVSGANQRVLTTAAHLNPSFSADGLHLAFVVPTLNGPTLDVAAANGPGPGVVYTAVSGSFTTSEPDWSPDSQSLVIGDKGGIEQVPAGGGSAHTLIANTPSTTVSAPSYSPDGTKLVFGSGPAAGGQQALFISAANGAGAVQIPNTGSPAGYDSQPDWSVPAGSGTGRAPTSTAVSCNYGFATFSETCTATVSGGGSRPTGNVTFTSQSGGVFPTGSTCTLSTAATSTASCQVTFDPPSQSLTVITTLKLTAGYAGDATHLPSSGTTAPSTGAILTTLNTDVQQACANSQTANTNPQTVLANGFTVTITIVAPGVLDIIAEGGSGSTLPVAADIPGARVAAGTGGSTPPTCTVTFEGGGSTLPVAADPGPGARTASATAFVHAAKCTTRTVHGHKHKTCTPAFVTIGHLHRSFTTRGGRYTLRIKLNARGRRAFKHLIALDKAYARHQRALDKAYFEKHHRKRHHTGHAPTIEPKLKISFKPA